MECSGNMDKATGKEQQLAYSRVASNKQERRLQGTNVFVQYLAAGTCCLLALMYGEAVGWSSSGLPQLVELHGQGSWEGWVGGCLCLGALASAPLHGPLADSKGRKVAGYAVVISFLIHWILLVSSTDIWVVLLARACGGVGAAGSITVGSLYSSEVADPHLRAALGGLMALLYTMGILLGFALGAWTSYLTAACIHLSICVVFLPAWWFAPESPAYLVLQGKDELALRSLKSFQGAHNAAAALQLLKEDQAGAEKPATLRQFFQEPAARRGLVLGCVLVSVQTFSGIFAVHSYAATIFARAGGALSPTASTMLYGGLMVVGAVGPPLLADRAPRKVLMSLSCGLLSLGMCVLGAQMLVVQVCQLDPDDMPTFLGLLPALALSVSVFVYYLGLGSVTYIIMAELFTDQMRGVANAFMSATIWATSFLLVLFFGAACEAFGDHSVFFFFALVCLAGTVFCLVCLPETRGRSQQEVVALLTRRREDKPVKLPA